MEPISTFLSNTHCLFQNTCLQHPVLCSAWSYGTAFPLCSPCPSYLKPQLSLDSYLPFGLASMSFYLRKGRQSSGWNHVFSWRPKGIGLLQWLSLWLSSRSHLWSETTVFLPSTINGPCSGSSVSAEAALAEATASTSVKGESQHEGGSVLLNLSCSCLAS